MKTIPLKEPLQGFQLENVKQWVAALRSAIYQQGIGKLIIKFSDSTFSYCCLGVACKIKGMEVFDSVFRYRRLNYDSMPPEEYFEFVFGFRSSKVMGIFHGLTVDLPTLNDNYHFTFAQIADVIESVCITRTSIEINKA